MENLSRRERERLNRRKEILQAAWRVFSSKDYVSATVDDIAEAAELSKGTIYLYFKNKADLFLSTFEMGVEMAISAITDVISANADPAVGLREIIKTQLELSEENIDFFKIISSERTHFELHSQMTENENFKQRILNTGYKNITIISDYIQRGVDTGVFKNVDAEDAAFILFSVLRGIAFKWIMVPDEGKLSDKADVIATIFLDGLKKAN